MLSIKERLGTRVTKPVDNTYKGIYEHKKEKYFYAADGSIELFGGGSTRRGGEPLIEQESELF